MNSVREKLTPFSNGNENIFQSEASCMVEEVENSCVDEIIKIEGGSRINFSFYMDYRSGDKFLRKYCSVF